MMGVFKGRLGSGTTEEQLLEEMQAGAILIDVRSVEAFSEATLPNAINIPVGRMTTSTLNLDKAATLVVFCGTGNRSSQAKHILEQKGYKRVIDAGIMEELEDVLK
mgnify:FL=1